MDTQNTKCTNYLATMALVKRALSGDLQICGLRDERYLACKNQDGGISFMAKSPILLAEIERFTVSEVMAMFADPIELTDTTITITW